MADFDDVRRIAGGLPEVEEAPSYRRMPAMKVRGRPFCRLWSPNEHARDGVYGTEVLVVFCDPDDKEMLLETSDGAVFSTDHYAGYPAVLIRLTDVSEEELTELLLDSYRTRAPASLTSQLPPPTGSAPSTVDSEPR